MGLHKIIHILRAEKCNKEKLEGFNNFYSCKEERCFRRYDRGATLSIKGNVYKICMLLTYQTPLEKAVTGKLDKIK